MTTKTELEALRKEINLPGKGSVLELRALSHKLLDMLEAESNKAEKAEEFIASLKLESQPIYQVEHNVEKDSDGNLIKMDWVDVSREKAEVAWEEYGLEVRVLYPVPQRAIVGLPRPFAHSPSGIKYFSEQQVKELLADAKVTVLGTL